MRMYDIMLFLALFGAVTGALQGIAGDTWFPDYTPPDMETVEVDTDVRYEKPNMTSSVDDSNAMSSFSALNLLWGTFKGIFGIGFVLNDIFSVESDGENMLWPIFGIVQVGIWVIYGIGIFQLLTGRSVKGME
jgi:hypothetical protein